MSASARERFIVGERVVLTERGRSSLRRESTKGGAGTVVGFSRRSHLLVLVTPNWRRTSSAYHVDFWQRSACLAANGPADRAIALARSTP